MRVARRLRMAHALALALGVPVCADGQGMRSDYQGLTSLGIVAGHFRADAGTPGVLGVALGVDRSLARAHALRLHVEGRWLLNRGTLACTAASCPARRVEVLATVTGGYEVGVREARRVRPFAGVATGLFLAGVTNRSEPVPGFLPADAPEPTLRSPVAVGLATDAWMGFRTPGTRYHWRVVAGAQHVARASPGANVLLRLVVGPEW